MDVTQSVPRNVNTPPLDSASTSDEESLERGGNHAAPTVANRAARDTVGFRPGPQIANAARARATASEPALRNIRHDITIARAILFATTTLLLAGGAASMIAGFAVEPSPRPESFCASVVPPCPDLKQPLLLGGLGAFSLGLASCAGIFHIEMVRSRMDELLEARTRV